MGPRPFQRIGAATLRGVVQDFVHRMVRDPMIGFFFWNVDVPTLVQREYEFTARFLGGDVPYTGRPMARAHRPHRIMGGQFDRRRQILKETLEDHQLPSDLQATWLEHVDRLRGQITQDAAGRCNVPEPEASDSSDRPPSSLSSGLGLRIVD